MPGPLDSLFAQTKKALMAPKEPGAEIKNLPFYSFTLVEENAAKDIWGEVTLRFPPSSISFRQGIRRQVTIDLANKPILTEYGRGLAQWTISGSHGVGWQAMKQAPDGSGSITAGLDARNQLFNIFDQYVEQNATRRKNGEPLLRMHFSITGGGPSEFKSEEWWVAPDGYPVDSRTAARPLAWDWSISLLGLERISANPTDSTQADSPLRVQQLKDAANAGLEKSGGLLDKLKSLWSTPPNGTMLDKIKNLTAESIKLKQAISGDIASIRDQAASITGMARGVAQSARGIMTAVKDGVADVRAITRADIKGTALAIQETRTIAKDIVVQAGLVKRLVEQVNQGRGRE